MADMESRYEAGLLVDKTREFIRQVSGKYRIPWEFLSQLQNDLYMFDNIEKWNVIENTPTQKLKEFLSQNFKLSALGKLSLLHRNTPESLELSRNFTQSVAASRRRVRKYAQGVRTTVAIKQKQMITQYGGYIIPEEVFDIIYAAMYEHEHDKEHKIPLFMGLGKYIIQTDAHAGNHYVLGDPIFFPDRDTFYDFQWAGAILHNAKANVELITGRDGNVYARAIKPIRANTLLSAGKTKFHADFKARNVAIQEAVSRHLHIYKGLDLALKYEGENRFLECVLEENNFFNFLEVGVGRGAIVASMKTLYKRGESIFLCKTTTMLFGFETINGKYNPVFLSRVGGTFVDGEILSHIEIEKYKDGKKLRSTIKKANMVVLNTEHALEEENGIVAEVAEDIIDIFCKNGGLLAILNGYETQKKMSSGYHNFVMRNKRSLLTKINFSLIIHRESKFIDELRAVSNAYLEVLALDISRRLKSATTFLDQDRVDDAIEHEPKEIDNEIERNFYFFTQNDDRYQSFVVFSQKEEAVSILVYSLEPRSETAPTRVRVRMECKLLGVDFTNMWESDYPRCQYTVDYYDHNTDNGEQKLFNIDSDVLGNIRLMCSQVSCVFFDYRNRIAFTSDDTEQIMAVHVSRDHGLFERTEDVKRYPYRKASDFIPLYVEFNRVVNGVKNNAVFLY